VTWREWSDKKRADYFDSGLTAADFEPERRKPEHACDGDCWSCPATCAALVRKEGR